MGLSGLGGNAAEVEVEVIFAFTGLEDVVCEGEVAAEGVMGDARESNEGLRSPAGLMATEGLEVEVLLVVVVVAAGIAGEVDLRFSNLLTMSLIDPFLVCPGLLGGARASACLGGESWTTVRDDVAPGVELLDGKAYIERGLLRSEASRDGFGRTVVSVGRGEVADFSGLFEDAPRDEDALFSAWAVWKAAILLAILGEAVILDGGMKVGDARLTVVTGSGPSSSLESSCAALCGTDCGDCISVDDR